jgi:hypothetical protein
MTEGEQRELRLRAFRRRRRKRLLSVLPGVYAQQPVGSVVYQLLDTMAGRLAELDDALEQVMAARWVKTAGGEPLFDRAAAPLDLLGALFDLPRLPADPDHGKPVEDTEAYRQRLMAMARLLARGVTTPEVLLQLTQAVLGAGVRAKIVDNPLVRRDQTVPAVQHDANSQLTFRVRNDGLLADRPVLGITALDGDMPFPAVRNITTSEVVLFAGVIPKTRTLYIQPALEAAERDAFTGVDRPSPPAGAYLSTTDVSAQIYYLAGSQFDKVRFPPREAADGPGADPTWPRFANPGHKVQTPLIMPGESRWDFLGYTGADLTGVTDKDGKPIAFPGAPQQPATTQVAITLSYYTRAPATFRLSVENGDAIRDDPRRARLLRDIVERTRGAGIRALVEFYQPPEQEDHGQFLADAAPRIDATVRPADVAGLRDPALRIAAESALTGERHVLADDIVFFTGVLDVTRFDQSRFG